jgi:DNA repair protein RadC
MMRKNLHIQDLTNTDTIYKIKTIQLKIRHEYITDPDLKLKTIRAPYDVYEILKVIFATLDEDREHLIILILNMATEITGYKLISSGAQEQSLVDCKVVFRNALLLGASCIILAHNHPSGKLRPSKFDLEATRKVIQAGEAIDIAVVDHIIYTTKGYTSLKRIKPSLFERAKRKR